MSELIQGRSLEQYQQLQAQHTAEEIHQQPKLWLDVLRILGNMKLQIQDFLAEHCSPKTKIVFTGAGTSEFVGNTIVPYLRKAGQQNVFSIATTDIVSSPESYLHPSDDVLLVSCARSGNSPESLAAVELLDAYLGKCSHIMLCCNPEGRLVSQYRGKQNALPIILEGANDKGFAMTGSFTSMLLAGSLIFALNGLNPLPEAEAYFQKVQQFLSDIASDVRHLACLGKQRIICLGTGMMKGIAQETHLKVLELTAGRNTAHFDSTLGFRHGPKSLLNDQSLVLFFMSDDLYSRSYEYDLLEEMRSNPGEHYIVAISPEHFEPLSACHKLLRLPQAEAGCSQFYALAAILFSQSFALENAIQLGNSADNPSPSGLVNRVVQGVNIYKHSCQAAEA